MGMDMDEVREEFLRVMHRFQRIHFGTMEVDGLTRGEFFALKMIRDHIASHPDTKGVYVSELATCLRVTPPAVSRMLRALEGRELIERSVDRDDRRTTYIVLTPAGSAALERESAHLRAFTSRVAERMGVADMAQMTALWSRLADIIMEEQKEK